MPAGSPQELRGPKPDVPELAELEREEDAEVVEEYERLGYASEAQMERAMDEFDALKEAVETGDEEKAEQLREQLMKELGVEDEAVQRAREEADTEVVAGTVAPEAETEIFGEDKDVIQLKPLDEVTIMQDMMRLGLKRDSAPTAEEAKRYEAMRLEKRRQLEELWDDELPEPVTEKQIEQQVQDARAESQARKDAEKAAALAEGTKVEAAPEAKSLEEEAKEAGYVNADQMEEAEEIMALLRQSKREGNEELSAELKAELDELLDAETEDEIDFVISRRHWQLAKQGGFPTLTDYERRTTLEKLKQLEDQTSPEAKHLTNRLEALTKPESIREEAGSRAEQLIKEMREKEVNQATAERAALQEAAEGDVDAKSPAETLLDNIRDYAADKSIQEKNQELLKEWEEEALAKELGWKNRDVMTEANNLMQENLDLKKTGADPDRRTEIQGRLKELIAESEEWTNEQDRADFLRRKDVLDNAGRENLPPPIRIEFPFVIEEDVSEEEGEAQKEVKDTFDLMDQKEAGEYKGTVDLEMQFSKDLMNDLIESLPTDHPQRERLKQYQEKAGLEVDENGINIPGVMDLRFMGRSWDGKYEFIDPNIRPNYDAGDSARDHMVSLDAGVVEQAMRSARKIRAQKQSGTTAAAAK